MEEALVSRLLFASAIAQLAGDRVSWFGFRRGEAGCQIALTLISPGKGYTHDGPDGLDRPRVRFDLRARDPDDLFALVRATIAEMEAAAEIEGFRFHPAQLAVMRTIDLGEQDGGEILFQCQLEFLFFHEEI